MPPRNSAPTKSINWDGFKSALLAKPEKLPPGDGWMTSKQIREKFKATEKAVLKALKNYPHEQFEGMVNDNGVLRRQVWYRPK